MSRKPRTVIQKRIRRSANMSLLLKVISTACLLGLFAVAIYRIDPRYVYLALLPALSLWLLDAYWMRREQLYRQLYGELNAQRRSRRRTRWTFSINDEIAKFVRTPLIEFCLQKSLIVFHGAVLIAILIVSVFTLLKQL